MRRHLLVIGSMAALLALAGCTTPTSPVTETRPPPAAASTVTSTGPATGSEPSARTREPAESPAQEVLVRFTSGETAVDVTITPDNPTARDFLSLLPLTLPVEEFAGREKLGQLPRGLETTGSPGSDPEDGDLIYFIPWGNVGFYYNTDGIGYSDQTIHLGTYNATAEQLARLEGGSVSVQIVK